MLIRFPVESKIRRLIALSSEESAINLLIELLGGKDHTHAVFPKMSKFCLKKKQKWRYKKRDLLTSSLDKGNRKFSVGDQKS